VSLILEALKKSEQQRQREKAPNLQSIHQPVAVAATKSMRPWWLLAVLILLCNMAFFGYWFWRQQNTAASNLSAPAQQTAAPATASTTSDANPAQPKQSASAPDMQPEFTRISPHHSSVSAAVGETAQPRIEEISELPENVRNNLPAMTFSFHVYSETPEQRTIIINDRRMREGDEISSDLKLQSITQDGVILLFEQHRIHISVLSDW
jgi:general secretion pathway protein B